MKTKALVLQRHGSPAEALALEERPLPDLQPDQVLVQMKASPINPADFNLMEGTYPISFSLPEVIGNEGAGVVMETGKAIRDLRAGQTVLFLARPGAWCEYRIVRREEVMTVPESIAYEQAAMLSVNPTTAWRMLHDFTALQPGEWIIQNAANSVVGRAVIAIARERGWKTVNVVRREECIAPLKYDGAYTVIAAETSFAAKVWEATCGADIRLGLNAVGGKSAAELAKTLAPHGTLVTYGAMARQPLEIPNGLLIFKDIYFRGFWLTSWYRQADAEAIRRMFDALFSLIEKRHFHIPVERRYSLDEYPEALAQAQRDKRSGKILFVMNE